MVGLLSGMDNEDRSSTMVEQKDKDVDVGASQADESIAQRPSEGDSQPAAENTDNADEVEHVKELKSILKQRGQYTFRKVKVDFDLIPKKIPYDEDDYTVEIKIVEKEPVKIKSWAALFAAKKAEAEAEAAAIAEAEEALKKAEEVQKREALKKANRAKTKKGDDHSELSQETLPSHEIEQGDQISAKNESSQEERREEPIETETISQSDGGILAEEQPQESQDGASEETDDKQQIELAPLEQPLDQLAESIVSDILDTVTITEDLDGHGNPRRAEFEPVGEVKDDEEISRTESLEAERSDKSERPQEDRTYDELDDISTQEETSVSQVAEDSITEESLSQALHIRSGSEEKLTSEEASVSHTEDSSSRISESEDSLKTVELQGKTIPKKVLVTASSLVEEILSEMPLIIQSEPQKHDHTKQSSPKMSENGTGKRQNNNVSLEPANKDFPTDTNQKDVNQESRVQQKRREFKKSNDAKIIEHVRKSLESADPEILETAEGILEDIEKIVIEKVGSAIP